MSLWLSERLLSPSASNPTFASISTEFTRPADTSAYGVSDVVSNSTTAASLLTFENAVLSMGGSAYLIKASLFTDQATCVAEMRLHLFSPTVTAVSDNEPFPLLYANKLKHLGYVDFAALAQEGVGSTAAQSFWSGYPILYICDSTTTNMYGILETKTAFTPASEQKFTIVLGIDKN